MTEKVVPFTLHNVSTQGNRSFMPGSNLQHGIIHAEEVNPHPYNHPEKKKSPKKMPTSIKENLKNKTKEQTQKPPKPMKTEKMLNNKTAHYRSTDPKKGVTKKRKGIMQFQERGIKHSLKGEL
ncbi:MAG: hypothetical protein ACUVQZ_01660 [Candidatus Caldatribacteriaceae bacterium]